MNATLTAPPRSFAPPEIELPSVSFFGRTLAEYSQFFALDVSTFRGRAVLDVAVTAIECHARSDATSTAPSVANA